MLRNVRPVLAEHGAAKLVTLAKRDGLHAGALKAEPKSTDPAE
jgi:hypothetical protein